MNKLMEFTGQSPALLLQKTPLHSHNISILVTLMPMTLPLQEQCEEEAHKIFLGENCHLARVHSITSTITQELNACLTRLTNMHCSSFLDYGYIFIIKIMTISIFPQSLAQILFAN